MNLLSLVFTLASFHVGGPADVNGINPGVGIEVGSYNLGVYVNSQRGFSAYATRSWERRLGRLGIGLSAGLVTGYDWPVLPIAFPYVRLDVAKGWALRVAVLPIKRPIFGLQVVKR